MKKILLTWADGMLAFDFQKYCSQSFKLFPYNKENLDITSQENIEKIIVKIKPDIILNCAAYTAVDYAEDIWAKLNYDINTLWVYNLAKISKKYNLDLITFSTDYVFDGTKENGYNENDSYNPINSYWTAKYLWEVIAKRENENTIIIRTSWLYGWGRQFKNFVNTMLQLSETKKELKIINDQFWNPSNTKDISRVILQTIQNIEKYRGKILHFSNETENSGISWFDFAKEIFTIRKKEIVLLPCSTSEYPTKAKRPAFSKLINNSDITLRNWKEWLRDYLDNF